MIYGFFYRLIMRLAHKFNWHYAPVIGPLFDSTIYQYWCKWCGLRMDFKRDVDVAEELFLKLKEPTKWQNLNPLKKPKEIVIDHRLSKHMGRDIYRVERRKKQPRFLWRERRKVQVKAKEEIK